MSRSYDTPSTSTVATPEVSPLAPEVAGPSNSDVLSNIQLAQAVGPTIPKNPPRPPTGGAGGSGGPRGGAGTRRRAGVTGNGETGIC